MAHAFVSYVRENSDQIDQLALSLYKRGIDTWIDRDIRPGHRWESAIRQGIKSGASFLACFSAEALSKSGGYTYEELTVAIDVLRELPSEGNWLIPVRLSECEIPNRDIGAGRSLRDLQWVDMFPNWEAGVSRIVSEVGHALTPWCTPATQVFPASRG